MIKKEMYTKEQADLYHLIGIIYGIIVGMLLAKILIILQILGAM